MFKCKIALAFVSIHLTTFLRISLSTFMNMNILFAMRNEAWTYTFHLLMVMIQTLALNLTFSIVRQRANCCNDRFQLFG